MKRKIRIEIEYNRILMDELSQFVAGCDLDIKKISSPTMVMNFITSAKLDKAFKQNITTQIKEHFKNEFVIYDIKIFDEGIPQEETEIL